MIIALLSLGWFLPQGSVAMERNLADWKPTKVWENPQPAQLAMTTKVSGTWRRGGGWDVTVIRFTSKGDGKYAVEFTTAGCLNSWRLLRTATLKDGVILFNKPVKDYASWTYDRLYCIRVGHSMKLFCPEAYYQELLRLEAGKTSEDWLSLISFKPKKATSNTSR